MQMGMSSNMADLLLEMADALNSGHMKMLEPRSPANTTPTTIENFRSRNLLAAYRGKASSAYARSFVTVGSGRTWALVAKGATVRKID
jgi:hypothetical protein